MTSHVDDIAIQEEQLCLVLSGIRQSLLVGVLLASMLLFALYHPDGALLLVTWYFTFLAVRFSAVMFAHRTLQYNLSGSGPRKLRCIRRTLIFNKFFEGVVWGALVWICLENANLAERFLLISVMAAICGNAVSLLSPIIALYLALVLPMLALVSTKLWLLGGSDYAVLAAICLLYVGAQFGQARIARRSISESIALRFENLDLIERLKSESETVAKARDDAELANFAKSKFLAAASHDLRQPIHALGLFLEVLSRDNLSAAQRKVLDNANSAALASAEMLNTLLDFSRIEAGVVQPRFSKCPIQPLLNKLESELAPQADAKGLIYRSRETCLWVHSDPALLELILRNIISNAIRYTDVGGMLVACRQRDGHVLIEVYDTGIGIDSAQQKNIFREFYQLGNPERDRRKGLGLGLAITDGLVRSLGHQLEIKSILGTGTRFGIVAGMVKAPQCHSAEEVCISIYPFDVDTERLAGKYILVVDDDEAVRLGMFELLVGWGCDCSTVEAYWQVMEGAFRKPDAIICDYRLRGEDTGGDVIHLLRNHYQDEIPALLVTGDTDPERLREATATGIPLLHKPLPPMLLRKTLVNLLSFYE